jgi:trigger factor
VSTQETESDIHSTESNDNISVTVTKKPHCQIKFDIKVTPQAVEAAYQKALKNVNKEIIIPGFRKGRAPDAMILEKYGGVVHKEFVDLVLQTGFNEAIQLTHLHPLRDGNMKRPFVHDCSREKGAHFTIEFEARPTMPAVKLEDLEVPRAPRQPVTDQERQNAIQNLQFQFATYNPIEERPVQENDFVNVSVTLLGDHPREVIQDQRTQVNATGLPVWLRQKVIGLRAGESAEGMTEQDPNLVETDPNFKSLPFRVTVHSIWQGDLPAIDDELAKRVGLQTVDDLYTKIDERLNQEVEEEAFRQEVQAIERLLVERYPIDLPQSYIDSNKDARLSDYLNQLEQQKRDYTEEDYKQIEQSVEQSTIFNLQLFFLLRKIASDNNITVDNQDISQELSRQVGLISSGRSSVDFNDREKVQEQLYNLALDRKIKEFLLDHVSFKD